MRLALVRKVARPIVLALATPLALVVATWATGNVATVVPGRVYRSAQLGPDGIENLIRKYHIKTVLNLRGRNPEQAWYRAERAAVLGAGATLVDVPLASDHWMSREQARALVEVLDTSEPPVLIHCEWGAERTGLAAAYSVLLRPGSSLGEARAQFSARHLFLPVRDGLIMRGHLDRYGDWLRAGGAAHSPDLFRLWIAEVYRPIWPSREHWECNPYPLKVVTIPGVDGPAHSVETWPSNRCPPRTATRTDRAVMR